MLATDLTFMNEFYQAITRYLKALDGWEECVRDVCTGPNSWGELRDPNRLKALQAEFFQTRTEINRLIRRATEITNQHGRSSPYGLLLEVTLQRPRSPFADFESQLSNEVRMHIHDVLIQTMADIEVGYRPKQTTVAAPKRLVAVKEHISEHLPKYIVALISAAGVIVAALLRSS